jgi:hypothetical protein
MRNFTMLPAYLDYTFAGGWYLTAGATYFKGDLGSGALFDALAESFGGSASNDWIPVNGWVFPFGLGWEYRGDGGFLFRWYLLAAYISVRGNGETAHQWAPGMGLSLGYAF